jgi:hypothetical protein
VLQLTRENFHSLSLDEMRKQGVENKSELVKESLKKTQASVDEYI